jgi:hypothetical protein
MFLFFSWYWVIAAVVVLNILWSGIRYSYVNIPAARVACFFVVWAKWPSAIGSAIYLFIHRRFVPGLIALSWPWLAGLIPPPGKIGVIELAFARNIGYVPENGGPEAKPPQPNNPPEFRGRSKVRKALGTTIGLALSGLLGLAFAHQGIAALLWTPLGFAFGLLSAGQMLLPLILGLPRAIRLVRKRQMRIGVFGRILVTPLIWCVGLFLVGFLWPSVVEFLSRNTGFNLGMALGTIGIILSPLSAKCRRDFNADFDRAYSQFYRIAEPLREAVEQGDPNAQAALGSLYVTGFGAPQDYAQAAAWYRKAAEQGDAWAQCNLGLLYGVGWGVPKDYAEACFWFDLAVTGERDASRREQAAKFRDELASHLTPADLSRVQQRARKWFEAHPAKPQ